MTRQLHMIELNPDVCRLVRFASNQGINQGRDEDLGYAAHAWLSGLFGDLAPKPFRLVEDRRGFLHLLGYTPHAREELLDAAGSFALPGAAAVCDLHTRFQAKPMPQVWAPARRIGFEVLLCPVTRKEQTEKDVFLRRCEALSGDDDAVSREQVYREWLVRQIQGAAILEEASMTRFRLMRFLRKPQVQNGGPRGTGPITRPQALFQGVLRIADGEAFHTLLARGLGRHRAFGYGMLLLRPPP